MNLVLSSDAMPRLKWTKELHQRFVDAVNQLGGPEKATPKSLKRVMAISGLTLYHLKSHLQKYRLGRSQLSQSQHHQISRSIDKTSIGAHEEEINDLQVTQALQMQMDVQKKLQEQIEVQRNLQLRIEAQGKCLRSVLKKAQHTLSDCTCSSGKVKQVKSQLGELVSMVNSGRSCPKTISLISALTETDDHIESSLASSDSSYGNYKHKGNPVVLSLMEMHPAKNTDNNVESDNRKRSKNGEGPNDFDLNSKCANESDSGIIDLN